MDPIANVKEQRELAASILDESNPIYDPGKTIEDAYRLAELVQALDAWQTAGGFSPYTTKAGR